MGSKFDFDYLVIGSGPAGIEAATKLAEKSASVALVEGGAFGGSKTTYTLPAKTALEFSNYYYKLRTFPELKNNDLTFNLPTLINRIETTARDYAKNLKLDLETAGVICLTGYAHLLSPHTVAVGDKTYSAKNFVLATGGKLNPGEIAGLAAVNYLTPETAFKNRRLPQAVLVVGGGETGTEIATYFAELNVKTLLLEQKSRLLPSSDKEISKTLTDRLKNDLGITVLTGATVVALEQDEISKRVIFKQSGADKFVRVDAIVLATGYAPALDFGLENAGATYKKSGIIVDKNGLTSAKNISAVGDCALKP